MFFGNLATTFSGMTVVYPDSGQAYPLTSDMTNNNWHISGLVSDYSSFGLAFYKCSKLDASAFSGISFVVSGAVVTGVATTAIAITLNVGTAGNEISSAWLNAHKIAVNDPDVPQNFGRCSPLVSKYDGVCACNTYSDHSEVD